LPYPVRLTTSPPDWKQADVTGTRLKRGLAFKIGVADGKVPITEKRTHGVLRAIFIVVSLNWSSRRAVDCDDGCARSI